MKNGKIQTQNVMAMALLLCKGKAEEKAMVLFEMIYPPEEEYQSTFQGPELVISKNLGFRRQSSNNMRSSDPNVLLDNSPKASHNSRNL